MIRLIILLLVLGACGDDDAPCVVFDCMLIDKINGVDRGHVETCAASTEDARADVESSTDHAYDVDCTEVR